MDHLRRAALYTWNTSILRVPIALVALCTFVWHNENKFVAPIAFLRAKHGDAMADRLLRTTYALSLIFICENLITAAAMTYNAHCLRLETAAK